MKGTSFVVIGSLASVIGAAIGLSSCSSSPRAEAVIVQRTLFQPGKIDEDIEFHRMRVQRDQAGATGWAMLAGAYLAKAREFDDNEAAEMAELAAIRSIELREHNNVSAHLALAASYLAQHEFPEARAYLAKLAERYPGQPEVAAAYADALIEVGEYQTAAAVLDAPGFAGELGIQAVKSRLLELKGDYQGARAYIAEIRRQLNKNLSAEHQTVAWYAVREGDLLAAMGRMDDAKHAYEQALQVHPRSFKAMSALSRLCGQGGDNRGVIDWGSKALTVTRSAELLGRMAAAEKQLHNHQEAKRYLARALEICRPVPHEHELKQGVVHSHDSAKAHGHTLDRHYAIVCADFGVELVQASEAAARDLRQRPDALSYDTAAWVAFRSGRIDEARSLMRRAMELGPGLTSVRHHAAKIGLVVEGS